MMDENKRKTLRDIHYRISGACGTCSHGAFSPGNDFGDCTAHTYEHLKQRITKDLSVYRYGRCPKHELRAAVVPFIHGFREFLEGQPEEEE